MKLRNLFLEESGSVIDYLREQSESKAHLMWRAISIQKGFRDKILALKHKRPDLKEYLEGMEAKDKPSFLKEYLQGMEGNDKPPYPEPIFGKEYVTSTATKFATTATTATTTTNYNNTFTISTSYWYQRYK